MTEDEKQQKDSAEVEGDVRRVFADCYHKSCYEKECTGQIN